MEQKQSVGRHISCIYRNFHIYLHDQLAQYNLGSGQFHFLMMLYNKDGVNQETLAEMLNIDKATSARAIKKLEEQGYVIRKRDENDRRNYNIYLTDKAKKLKPKVKSILLRWTKQILQDLTEEEKEHLFTILEKISQNATAIRKQE
jgi:DNA-binding MarR family transcriptional regulator